MRREVSSVRDGQPLEEVIEMLLREHIHGVPVLDAEGDLVGMVTQQDIFFSTATLTQEQAAGSSSRDAPKRIFVKDVMTSPAVSASEETDVRALSRMMHRLRIHRVPIVADGRVTGIVSSLDICNLVAQGVRL